MSGSTPLSFPDQPRGELDDALAALMTQAQRVAGAQGRLRELLHAVQRVVGEIELPVVLRRVVEAAIDLVGADYGAIGALTADHAGLDQFVFVGMNDDEVRAIGHPPQGRGLLGALTADPRPIRLSRLDQDPRSAGLPANHPPMQAFLGVPIPVRGGSQRNLYLTRGSTTPFTKEDEELVEALATVAGAAIEHARLFEEARMREQWMTASAHLTSAILTTPLEEVMDLIAGRVYELTGADRVCVAIPDGDSDRMLVAAVRGEREDLLGVVTEGGRTIADHARAHGPARTPETTRGAEDPYRVTTAAGTGAAMAIPLRSRARTWGVVVIGRSPGGADFTALEETIAGSVASQVGIALELAHARALQRRALLTDERARIARDLHDHVIQQLFGAGLALQSTAGLIEEATAQAGVSAVIGQLDEAIGQIRTLVFALSERTDDTVRHRIIDAVGRTAGAARRPPSIRFVGPVDHLIVGDLADDVVAVATELLSNSVRHAGAAAISLEVAAQRGSATVTVEDDGVGIPDAGGRRSGLGNLAERARARRGGFTIESTPGRTVACWCVPVGASGPSQEAAR